MATLTVTPDGRITMPPEVLKHLGVEPGQAVELELLPNRHIAPLAPKPERTGTWAQVAGCLAGKTSKVATIEEINDASGPEWDPDSW